MGQEKQELHGDHTYLYLIVLPNHSQGKQAGLPTQPGGTFTSRGLHMLEVAKFLQVSRALHVKHPNSPRNSGFHLTHTQAQGSVSPC